VNECGSLLCFEGICGFFIGPWGSRSIGKKNEKSLSRGNVMVQERRTNDFSNLSKSPELTGAYFDIEGFTGCGYIHSG
jgi:hypothetical protein